MNIGELVAVLEGMDPNKTVWADGCDCTNPITGVSTDTVSDSDEEVAIIRVRL